MALALRWQGVPSYERIAAFAEGIRHGLKNTVERRKPIYIMLDGDIAQTLGAILREELLIESEIWPSTASCCATSTTSTSAASACRPIPCR